MSIFANKSKWRFIFMMFLKYNNSYNYCKKSQKKGIKIKRDLVNGLIGPRGVQEAMNGIEEELADSSCQRNLQKESP